MKFKILKEENGSTSCSFVADGLPCVIYKYENGSQDVGYVKGERIFVGKIESLEKTAADIIKEIEINRPKIDNLINSSKFKNNSFYDQNYNTSSDWQQDRHREALISEKRNRNRMQIINIIKTKNITKLIHFTDIRNIESILEHGILPPTRLEERSIESHANDPMRFDKQLGGISVSVMKRNQHVLNKFHKRDPRRWVEIEINPDVAVNKNCLFYQSNASNRKFADAEEKYLTSSKAFANMFASDVNIKGRIYTRENKKEYEPTDEQAEIIVRWIIPKRKILSWKEIDV
jgi:hypothetical protein